MPTPHPAVFDSWIQESAERHSVPAELVKAVIETESHFNPTALNEDDPGGAWGLMQLLPPTARWMGWNGSDPRDLLEPRLNIELGTKFLGYQLRRYGGRIQEAVSAYNAGTSRIRPDGTFTNQAYVSRVGENLLALGTNYAALEHPPASGTTPALPGPIAPDVRQPLLSAGVGATVPWFALALLALAMLAAGSRGILSRAR